MQPSGGELHREELQQQLAALAERDPAALSLFAARCGLRTLPLLVAPDDFSYWPEEERTANLLSVWRAWLVVWTGQTTTADHAACIHKAVTAKGFIAGAENSSLQGEALAWANLLALAEQAVRIASGISRSEQLALSISIAEVAVQFLRLQLDENIAAVVMQDLSALASSDAARLRAAPLWLNGSPPPRMMEQVFERWPQQLQQRAKLDASRDQAGAELLQRATTAYPPLFDGKYSTAQAQEELDLLQRYFDQREDQREAPVSPQVAKAAPAAAGEKVADTALRHELSFRPSDRQSIEQISAEDHLNRGKLVSALATILAARGNDSHQTIGLLGDWGVGKSTVVQLLKNELIQRQSQQEFLFAEFNAWAYEHTDNLQAGIAQEMMKALSSDIPRPKLSAARDASLRQRLALGWRECVAPLAWWRKRIAITWNFAIALNGKKLLWLLLLMLVAIMPFTWHEAGKAMTGFLVASGSHSSRMVVATVGTGVWVLGFLYYFATRLKTVFANPLAKELLTYLKLPDYGEHLGAIPVMRKNIETLCKVRLQSRSKKRGDQRLLFVVDDLDRCGHEGIVKVFEAVRLVLDLPRVTVIIAVDQRIALAALALHYKDLAEHHQLQNPRAIARDYLAKVIHLPILLGVPDDASIEGYLEHIWKDQSGGESYTLIEPVTAPADTQPSSSPSGQKSSTADQNPLQGAVLTTAAGGELNTAPTGAANVAGQSAMIPATTPAASPAGNGAAVTSSVAIPNVAIPKVAIPPQKVIPGLSEQQRHAFLHWVKHFRLANPRQLKRLHNSYNLLRHFYGEDGASAKPADNIGDLVKTLEFPLMITLFALEYLNSLDDPPLRTQLKSSLRGRTKLAFEDEAQPKIRQSLINLAVITLVNRSMPGSHLHLVDAVEPFVLPAIEQNVEAPANVA